MKKLLLFCAIALTACEKDEQPICGPIVGATRYGEAPTWQWFHVVKDEDGNLHEVPIENYVGAELGRVICID